MKSISGNCLCGSVSFKIFDKCRYSVICHCTMCQKSNAEFSNYTKVQKDNFKFVNKGYFSKKKQKAASSFFY